MSKLVTLVVAVKNEDEAIAPFLEAIDREVDYPDVELEILFVDDGSTDNTLQALQLAAQRDSRVRWLKLSRNFGKEAAMTAGLDHARGDGVIPMDVDLQDPPALINDFIRLWLDEGYAMIYGVRVSRHEDTRRKRTSANLFYRLFNRISPTPIPDNAGDFRLLDRQVVEALKRLPERNRFMKGLFAWSGYRSVGVPYERPARQVGESKFNLWKLWNFALDGLVGFSTLPLRVWSYIGGGVALLSFVYILVIVFKALVFGRDTPGYASVMSAVLFFGGMQLLSIGVLGEYMARLFVEVKQRPLYLVEVDSLGSNKAESIQHGKTFEGSDKRIEDADDPAHGERER
ncbi:glycosyltransferase family 2 protein [Salinicola sp. 4072]|uniref:glycosyltransferase family 2 protein n=1 Tax=Salinicola sp. 4072 TaxID=3082157 RepID=UPI002FC6C1B9